LRDLGLWFLAGWKGIDLVADLELAGKKLEGK
jgi:hypothetical protein